MLGGTDRYSQLLNGDDPVALFCGGGCHVFALELNARYGYPLMLWERAHGRIAHVYCLRNGIEIDAQAPVVGKGIFERFDVGTERLTHKPVTVVKLLEMVPGDNWEKEKGGPYGLRDEGSFMVLAREKARIFLDEDARKGDRARFPPSALADQKPS